MGTRYQRGYPMEQPTGLFECRIYDADTDSQSIRVTAPSQELARDLAEVLIQYMETMVREEIR